jgi:2-polyprenyl-3-methyl-5-hydroxy-6-metoxy-1,4-benzoquinol methylase
MLRDGVLQTDRCYCCGGGVEPFKDRLGFSHLRCPGCGLLRIHPDHLARNEEVYTEAYFNGSLHRQTGGKIGYSESYADPATSHRTGQYQVYADEVLRLVRLGGPERPRVLDVGCAYGFFLGLLKEQAGDLEVHGVELDPEVCRQAAANLGGAPVYCADLSRDGCSVPEEYFDVVTLIDVIEHLDDPEKYLRLLAKRVKPGGHIVLSTPNIESLNAKLYGDRWVLHTPPLHTYYFGPRSLSILLKRAGWEPAKLFTERTIFHNERHGMETWRGKTFRLLFQNQLCDALTNRMMHLGSIMTLVARKVERPRL